eukprot:973983-Pelagomonas_calceolata.AAC.6
MGYGGAACIGCCCSKEAAHVPYRGSLCTLRARSTWALFVMLKTSMKAFLVILCFVRLGSHWSKHAATVRIPKP